MPLYRYEAVAASGEIITGEVDAPDQTTVVAQLQNAGHTPIRADIAGGRKGLKLFSRPLLGAATRSRKSLVLVTQQLATLLQAGLALDRALEIAQTVATEAERTVLEAVLDKIRGGSSLADAMAAQPHMFPNFYVGMVRAGEAGGSLDATLRQLGDYLERSQASAEQVKSALTYPLIVLATGSGSIAVLFGFVVPRFRPLFEEAGTSLPFMAQAVLAVADVFRNYWWALLTLPILAAALVAQRLRDPATRSRWDRRVLTLPLFGELIVRAEIARFSRTLGTLLKNGVAPLSALAITKETLRNAAVRDAIASVGDSVKEGKGLAEPLSKTKVVPLLALQLIRVGEETARLEEMLLKVAEIYDQEVRRSIDRMLAMLVPGITIVLGIVVALVIGSILTAVLSVYELAI